MDIAAVILEDGTVLRVGETLTGGAVEPERLGHAVRFLVGVAVDVDPEEPSPAQPTRPVLDVVEPFDLIAIEEDCVAHPGRRTPRDRFRTASRNLYGALMHR